MSKLEITLSPEYNNGINGDIKIDEVNEKGFVYIGIDRYDGMTYINADQAQEIIRHLTEQFKLKKGDTAHKNFNGEFEVVDGKLSFTCHTTNIPYEEVLEGIIKLRDELNRQIADQTSCPHYKET